LHRFGDIPAFMCSWPHPYSTLIFGVFPLHQIAHVGVNVSSDLKLFGRAIIFEIFQPMRSRYLNVTDRGTDRGTDDMQFHNRALRSIAQLRFCWRRQNHRVELRVCVDFVLNEMILYRRY